MILDTTSYDNPLHPRFIDDADGAKRARFERDFRWLHAEAVQKSTGNLERAKAWALRWRSQPDDVEAALMLAVVQLIEDAQRDKQKRMVRMIAARHARRMMTPEQYARDAA